MSSGMKFATDVGIRTGRIALAGFSCDPRDFKDLPQKTKSKQLREILSFYIPLAKEEEGRSGIGSVPG